MFPRIENIKDIQSKVAQRREIRFTTHDNGATTACYAFQDRETFDSAEALECRGIAFDRKGQICSRPLHKFFNVGEREYLQPEQLIAREDWHSIQEKLDGSMIATAWIDGELVLRSRRSFTADVVKLADVLLMSERNLYQFMLQVAARGHTAIFELTHPQARIVVPHEKPHLRLLHVRENITGAYVLLDSEHWIWELINKHSISMVETHKSLDLRGALSSLANMEQREGYVAQMLSGEMVKMKCPWYLRLHHCISLLRERDVARLALHQELDDTREALREIEVDMAEVDVVATRVKQEIVSALDEVDRIFTKDRDLDRKSFAVRYKQHELFPLLMQRYSGREPDLVHWYEKNRLRQQFGLRVLGSGALAEAIDNQEKN